MGGRRTLGRTVVHAPTPRSGPRSPQRPLVDKFTLSISLTWRSQSFLEPHLGADRRRTQRPCEQCAIEVAVDFQGAVRSALVARWSGAPTVYGCASREKILPACFTRARSSRAEPTLSSRISHSPKRRWSQAAQIPQVELPYDAAAEKDCDQQLRDRGIGDFVILNPGAGWGAKQWPAERYGYVAKRLEQHGLKSLINFGPGEEDLVREVEAASGGAAKGIACSLTQLNLFALVGARLCSSAATLGPCIWPLL